jgi:hypothetical protein
MWCRVISGEREQPSPLAIFGLLWLILINRLVPLCVLVPPKAVPADRFGQSYLKQEGSTHEDRSENWCRLVALVAALSPTFASAQTLIGRDNITCDRNEDLIEAIEDDAEREHRHWFRYELRWTCHGFVQLPIRGGRITPSKPSAIMALWDDMMSGALER